jgi:hypothetical protein
MRLAGDSGSVLVGQKDCQPLCFSIFHPHISAVF